MIKAIEIRNLSKTYDLGLVGTGTLSKDLNRSWAKLRGKPDPYATIAEINDRTKKSVSNMVYALKDVNFSVNQGDVLGIIGKNGAGKSTLLKILSQITSPSTGEIIMRGRVASLLEVGTGMHPEMTARQNIYLNGAIMGMKRFEITKKLDEIVDFAGIEKYIDTPVKRFSSGMKVRLGFAVAAFLEPEILIVDEVLAVGDAEFQKKAVGKIKDVTKGMKRTVLFVSHNLNSIRQLCNKAVLIDNGQVTDYGEVEKIIQKYLNTYRLNINNLKFQKRSGHQNVILKKLKVLDKQIKTGGTLPLSFELKNTSPNQINNIDIAISIHESTYLRRIAIFKSSYKEFSITIDPNCSKEINCKISNILLTEGKYYIKAIIYTGEEVSDWIENIIDEFEINFCNYYNSGKGEELKKELIVLNGTWLLKEN